MKTFKLLMLAVGFFAFQASGLAHSHCCSSTTQSMNLCDLIIIPQDEEQVQEDVSFEAAEIQKLRQVVIEKQLIAIGEDMEEGESL